MGELRNLDDVLVALRRDHVNARKLLSLVRTQVRRIDGGETPDWNLLATIMRYLFEYDHLFHHRIEDVLYERLRLRAGAARATLDQIPLQHAALEQQVAGCRLLIAAAGAEGGETPSATMVNVFADDLERHMQCEEQHLFPLIELLFTATDWLAVHADLKRPRDPLFEVPVRESYRELAGRIGD